MGRAWQMLLETLQSSTPSLRWFACRRARALFSLLPGTADEGALHCALSCCPCVPPKALHVPCRGQAGVEAAGRGWCPSGRALLSGQPDGKERSSRWCTQGTLQPSVCRSDGCGAPVRYVVDALCEIRAALASKTSVTTGMGSAQKDSVCRLLFMPGGGSRCVVGLERAVRAHA